MDCARGVNAGGRPAFRVAPHVDAVGDRVRSVFLWLAAWARRLELGDSRPGQGPPRFAWSSARESATRSAGDPRPSELVIVEVCGNPEQAGENQPAARVRLNTRRDVRNCQRPSERGSGN